MTPDFSKWARRVAAKIPGTKAHARACVANEKRQLERKLRGEGWSRAAANTEVALRFGKRGG